jgi:hypothetical protein
VSGLNIWLHACVLANPVVLRRLLAAGCSVAETYVEDPACADEEGYRSGWSCIFFVVLHASRPESSLESESLRTLLSAGADPFLRNAEGYTIFDYVDDDVNPLAGYRRELWYNALRRAQIHTDHFVRPRPKQTNVASVQ